MTEIGALFDKVYRLDVLWQAWRQVRANGGGPGIDGDTINYIETEIGVMAFLRELRDELQNETYRAQPVKRVWIDKPGSADKRPLGVACVEDKIVQRAVVMILERIYEVDFCARTLTATDLPAHGS